MILFVAKFAVKHSTAIITRSYVHSLEMQLHADVPQATPTQVLICGPLLRWQELARLYVHTEFEERSLIVCEILRVPNVELLSRDPMPLTF